MDQNQIINTPGLQHIIEVIFFNLDFVDFMNWQQINKAIRDFFIDPHPKTNFVK